MFVLSIRAHIIPQIKRRNFYDSIRIQNESDVLTQGNLKSHNNRTYSDNTVMNNGVTLNVMSFINWTIGLALRSHILSHVTALKWAKSNYNPVYFPYDSILNSIRFSHLA